MVELVREIIRGLVALGVVGATTALGIRGVLDAAAVTGILGAAVGVVGTSQAVAAIERINGRRNGRKQEAA